MAIVATESIQMKRCLKGQLVLMVKNLKMTQGNWTWK